jgi:hypothetical protein
MVLGIDTRIGFNSRAVSRHIIIRRVGCERHSGRSSFVRDKASPLYESCCGILLVLSHRLSTTLSTLEDIVATEARRLSLRRHNDRLRALSPIVD